VAVGRHELGNRGQSQSVETQGQDATVQESSWQGQQPSTRKEKINQRSKERRRAQRSKDFQSFTKLCELFNIPTAPRKTLPYRSECFISVISRCIDFIIVLACIEDLMHRLEQTEAAVVALREDLTQPSAKTTTGSTLLRSKEWRHIQSEDFQPLTKLCELFNITPAPRSTLHHRSECFYTHH
jgi:hypothetical protein